jgi:hypothetical protein
VTVLKRSMEMFLMQYCQRGTEQDRVIDYFYGELQKLRIFLNICLPFDPM